MYQLAFATAKLYNKQPQVLTYDHKDLFIIHITWELLDSCSCMVSVALLQVPAGQKIHLFHVSSHSSTQVEEAAFIWYMLFLWRELEREMTWFLWKPPLWVAQLLYPHSTGQSQLFDQIQNQWGRNIYSAYWQGMILENNDPIDRIYLFVIPWHRSPLISAN